MNLAVIHNFFDEEDFCCLNNIITSRDFPYFRASLDYYNTNNLYLQQWQHHFKEYNKNNSPFCEEIEKIIFRGFKKNNIAFNNIDRIRLGLHNATPLNYQGGAHVDVVTPHKVCLVYLNDSDGDTIIYNEFFNPMFNLEPYEYVTKILNDKITISSTHKPVCNKAVLFDGFQYHSSSTPKSSLNRIVININFT